MGSSRTPPRGRPSIPSSPGSPSAASPVAPPARRRAPRRGRRRGRRLALLLPALLAVACGCPPKLVDYTSPEATLRTWQTHLCHDEPKEEYACFSSDYARTFGGYGNYVAFRDHLVSEEPVLAYIVERKDLTDNIVGFGIEPDGLHGWAILQALGERIRLGFVREVWVTITYRDGRKPLTMRQRPTFAGLLNLSGQRQWLLVDRPDIDADDVPVIESIHYDSRWLIDDFGAVLAP